MFRRRKSQISSNAIAHQSSVSPKPHAGGAPGARGGRGMPRGGLGRDCAGQAVASGWGRSAE